MRSRAVPHGNHLSLLVCVTLLPGPEQQGTLIPRTDGEGDSRPPDRQGQRRGGVGGRTLSLALFLHVDTVWTDAFLSSAALSLHPELSRAPHQGALTPLP